jgi:hypothetical protein
MLADLPAAKMPLAQKLMVSGDYVVGDDRTKRPQSVESGNSGLTS